MHRRIASALMVALSVAAAVGLATPASASNAGSFIAQINADRARVGRAPLTARADLAAIALRHTQTMAAANSLHHNAALTSQVPNWRSVGENVGVGGNTRVLHAAFMNSPAHRANILDKDYTEIGLGVAVDARGVMWVTEVFRQPMRVSPGISVRTVAPASTTRAKAAVAVRRPVVKRPAPPKAPAVRWVSASHRSAGQSSSRSTWLGRVSAAAHADNSSATGALAHAIQYLHVVAG